jgi:hypothetical protein
VLLLYGAHTCYKRDGTPQRKKREKYFFVDVWGPYKKKKSGYFSIIFILDLVSIIIIKKRSNLKLRRTPFFPSSFQPVGIGQC